MGAEIQHLHHVGHVVGDMERALELYRRLGFLLAPPAYPTLSRKEGELPRPVGAANTHATFLRNFIEIMTVIRDDSRIPANANLVPIEVPAAILPRVLETLDRTVATLSARLARFEGLHILVFQTPDVGRSAAQFDKDGVRHSGSNTVRRSVETASGMQMVPVHFLEIDGEEVPEGRLAIAENPPAEVLRAQSHLSHPNGAVDLVESILCVAESDLEAVSQRYQKYLGREPRQTGAARVFDLEGSRVTITADRALAAVLAGDTGPTIPSFVAYAVAVRDLAATRKLLEDNAVPLAKAPGGDFFVPAAAAMGAAVIFRQA